MKPGGRVAGYLIYQPDGLTEEQRERAYELGPVEAGLPMPIADLIRQADLRLISITDVTEQFFATAEAVREEWAKNEPALREEEGDEVFEEEFDRKLQIMTAIREQLLLRALIVAERAPA